MDSLSFRPGLWRAGFRSGQEPEVRASGGIVTIVPRLPNADDEYTPEQRRIIDARLMKARAEGAKGRTAGPFETANEMSAAFESRGNGKHSG